MLNKVLMVFLVGFVPVFMLNNVHAQLGDASLLAYWPFDGDLLDASGNGNDFGGMGNFSPSDYGQALNVQPSYRMNEPGGPNTSNITGNSGTVTLRVNASNPAGNQIWFARGGTSIDHTLPFRTKNNSFWIEAVSDTHVTTGPNTIQANTWHTVVVTSDDTQYRIWIDGDEKTLAKDPSRVSFMNTGLWWSHDPTNPSQKPSSGTISVGNMDWQNGSTANADGMIDEIAVWDRVLTDSEIAVLSTTGVMAVLGGGGGAPERDFAWRVDDSGDWNLASNWSPASQAPNSNTETATFGDTITSPQNIFTNSDVTVRSMVFDHDITYIISGFGKVNLETGSVEEGINANIHVVQGDHQFQGAVNVNSTAVVDIENRASLEFVNRLNLNDNQVTKTGEGSLVISNTLNTGDGSLICSEGLCAGSGTIAGDVNNTGGTISPGALLPADSTTAVPEPASLTLLAIGLVTSMVLLRWSK